MKKFLKCYPFCDPGVRLVEGFSVYDGNLKDKIGAPHKGIDYAFLKDGKFVSFDVFSMHQGKAIQGSSSSWGKFVVVYLLHNDNWRTIYAHLSKINPKIPLLENREKKSFKELIIDSDCWLGRAGLTGETKHLIQLHLELHQKSAKREDRIKLDPYGVNDRLKSGKYPQPGESLAGLKHCWIKDLPPLASSDKNKSSLTYNFNV